MDSVKSAPTLQELTFDLSLARAHLENLLSVSEAKSTNPPMLKRLLAELSDAIAAAEQTCTPEAPFEDCLEKKSHILWLCNQCDYYLAIEPPAASKFSQTADTARSRNGHWQVRAVVLTMLFLKITAQLRRFFLGSTPPMPAWRELLAGLQLWKIRRSRRNG
ncbi:MAG: hypothetical protein AAF528_13870 [Cyanobacteria bacterium P01_C01_bin.121]